MQNLRCICNKVKLFNTIIIEILRREKSEKQFEIIMAENFPNATNIKPTYPGISINQKQ